MLRFPIMLLAAVSLGKAPQTTIDTLSAGRIMFLGDSNTQAGEYVSQLEYCLDALFPTKQFDIVSVGLASETASGLTESIHPFPRPCIHERLWAALDMVKPKIVFACYGINDGIYHPFSRDRFKSFEVGIQKLIEIDRAAGAKTILLTPPPFDRVAAGSSVRPLEAPDFSYINVYSGYDEVMGAYSNWEKTLAAPDVFVVDTHSALNRELDARRVTNHGFTFSGDGVHINEEGHWVMATAVLEAFGIPKNNLPFGGDFAQVSRSPLYRLVSKRRQLRSSAWLPYIGYVRGDAFKSTSVEGAEREAAALQNEIDRLRKTRKY